MRLTAAATALALALLHLLPLAAPTPTPLPTPAWALLIAGSADPADRRHAAGAVALAGALAARSPATATRLFLAATPPPEGWGASVAALVGPAAADALPSPLPPGAVGPDVTPALALAALASAHPAWHPPAWRLPTAEGSAAGSPASTGLVFLTGHGGPGFLRVGGGVLTRRALGRGLRAALARGAAGRILVVADTCRAVSLAPPALPPFLTALTSAGLEEASHAGGFWAGGGAAGYAGATGERFTAALVGALLLVEGAGRPGPAAATTLVSLLAAPAFAPTALLSTPAIAGNASWRVADFFGPTRKGGGEAELPGGCTS